MEGVGDGDGQSCSLGMMIWKKLLSSSNKVMVSAVAGAWKAIRAQTPRNSPYTPSPLAYR